MIGAISAFGTAAHNLDERVRLVESVEYLPVPWSCLERGQDGMPDHHAPIIRISRPCVIRY